MANKTIPAIQTNEGNVGIGVTNPRVLLDLAKANNVGQVLLLGEVGANVRVGFGLHPSNAGMRIFSLNHVSDGSIEFGGISSSDGSTWTRNHRLGLAGGNSFFNEQGGNVGIGTNNPSAKLEVAGSLRVTGVGQIGPAGGYGIALFNDQTNNFIGQLYGRASGVQFTDGAGINTVYIASGGKVGIGTTNPLALLSVGAGSLNDGNVPIQISSAGPTTERWIGVNRNGSYGLILGYYEGSAIAGSGAYVRQVSADPLHFAVNNTSVAMSILSNTNIGIGTTNPSQKLDVNGAIIAGINNSYGAYTRTPGGVLKPWFATASANTFFYNTNVSGSIFWQNAADSATLMILTDQARLGINTNVPSGRLHVLDTVLYPPSLIWNAAAATIIRSENGQIAFGSDDTAPYGIWQQVRTSSSTARPLLLNPLGGNIGIGIRNPSDRLHVAGSIRISGGEIIRWDGQGFIDTIGNNDLFFRPNQTFKMILTAAGRLGVGLLSPDSLIGVGGAGSTTAASGITFGADAQANLYRAGEDTIKTDGSLNVAGLIYNANSAYYSSVSKSTTANWGQYTVVLGNASYSSQLVQVSVNGGNLVWAGTFLASCHLSYRPNETWINVKLLECATYNCSNDDVTLLALSNSTTSQFGTPSLVLKTNGAISAGGGTGAANTITVTVNGPSPNEFVLSSSSWTQPYTYQIATSANTKQIYVTESGNVGIGINSPSSQANYKFLQVNGTNSAVIETMVGGARIGGFDSTASALYVGTIGNFPVVFRTQVDEKMRIAAGGNVGIATNNPGDRLHVNLNSGENILANIAYNGVSALNKVSFRLSELGTPLGEFSAVRDGTSYQVKLQTVISEPLSFGTNSVTRMVIDTAGNVGIGTTNPTQLLESYKSTNAVTFNYLASNLNNNSPVATYAFDVTNGSTEARSTKAGIGYERHLTNGRGTLHIYNRATDDAVNFGGTRSTPVDIKVSIANDGNVGISSTVPGARLDVVGAARISANILSHKTASYTTSYPGINSFGGETTDTGITYYDTGKLAVNTNIRGIVWTGKHYIFTDYANYRAYFYDNNFTQITNAYGVYFVTLPRPTGYDYPHGAAWDGRYLWCVVYTGAASKIVGYDIDTNGTATIIAESVALPYAALYDIEYADGHLYVINSGNVYIYKWNGSSIDLIGSYTGGPAGSITPQAITYDGSYLWVTQNGTNAYKLTLDGGYILDIGSGSMPPNITAWAWNGSNIITLDFSSRKIYVINTKRLRIDTQNLALMGGNVGIGSTAPAALLNIRASAPAGVGSTTAGTNLLIDSSTNNYITFRNSADNATYAGLVFLDNNVGGYVAFGNAGAAVGSDSMIYGAYQDHIFQNNYVNETLYNRPETMRIKQNGRVGIGTNTPTTLLSVGGLGSTTAASGITFGGDAQANLYRAGEDIMKTDATLQVGGNFDGFGTVQAIGSILHRSTIRVLNKAATDWVTWFTRDTSESETIGRLDNIRSINGSVAGNLGIGTTLPSGKLHVVSSVSNDTVFRADGTNGTLFSVVDDLSDSLMSVNNSAGLPVLEVFADDRIVMGQYGVNDFVLTNNKIGLGTNNPQFELDIVGAGTNAAVNVITRMRSTAGSDVFNTASVLAFTNTTTNSSAYSYIGGRIDLGGAGDNAQSLVFATNATNTLPTEKMRIKSDGTVGIGTTNPSWLLTTYAAVAPQFALSNATRSFILTNNAGDNLLSFNYNSANRLQFDTANQWFNIGNLGVGTTVPAQKLDVRGYIISDVNSNAAEAGFFLGSNAHGIRRAAAVNDIRLYTTAGDIIFSAAGSGSQQVTLKNGGNFGINITTPTSRLHVVETTPTGSRIQLGSISTSALMNANLVNDFLILTAPFNAVPASTSNNNAKWGIKLNGSIDSPNTNSKSAAIYAVSEEDAVGGAGYNRKVGIALHTSEFDLEHTERVRINNLGNVGIGATNPSQKLDVRGNIKLGADNAGNYIYYVKDTEGTIINTSRSDASQQGLLRSDGWGNFTVDKSIGVGYSLGSSFPSSTIGNGNLYVANAVGINTTSPAAALDVRGGILRTNSRISNSEGYPLGHYAAGETVFEIDPTWSQAELQKYFNSSNVTWVAVADAPGGYCIYINDLVQVGGFMDSGFPYIPVDTNDIFYMECWIQNVGTNQAHYMGSQDLDQNFGNLGGNPGSYGYWVMSNYNPGTSWIKVTGYIGGFSNTIGQFKAGTKYWTPQALFNYTAGTGTRACRISGWKVIKVYQPGNRFFAGTVGIGLSNSATILGVGGAGSTSAASGITFGADSAANIYRSSTSQLKTDGSFVVTNTLTVGGADLGARVLKNGSDSISSTLYLANAANSRAYNFQPNAAGTNLALWAYNSSNAWINTVNFNYDGNVGIGASPVAARLHIKGDGSNPVLRVETADLQSAAGGTAGKTFVGWLPIMTGALSPADKVFIPLYK